MRLIDADELKKKFQERSYWTYTYEYGDAIPIGWIMSGIDNAPTADDWQKFSDELWKNAYEKGKKDVIHSIAEQYSEHNELVPIWLSIGDIRGGKE